MKQFKTIIFTVTGILGMFLAACSDSGTGVTQVESVNELGECEESNEGVTKLVTSENHYYKCVDGDWEETDAPVQSSSSKNPTFPGGGVLKDSRDGQTYRTVKIGNQVWMAENLNYRYLGPATRKDSSSFCYNDDPAYCETYGRLYMWSAAMDSAGIIKGNTANGCGYFSECAPSETVRGVCPQGWHLPSSGEWRDLFTAVGGSSVAGKMLKSETGWEPYSGIECADTFGFSALPAGYSSHGNYYTEGYYAYFCSSTADGSGRAYYVGLEHDYDHAYLDGNNNYTGCSVRCLKD